jgi:hypothetical protein
MVRRAHSSCAPNNIHIRHNNSVLSRDLVPLKVDLYKEEYELDFTLKQISSITASLHYENLTSCYHLLFCVRN